MKEAIFCKCGRIHIVELNYDAMDEENKEVAVVCGGCGKISVHGLENYLYDENEEVGKACYTYNPLDCGDTIKLTDFRFNEHSELESIIFSKGIRVPMMNGSYANSFDGDNTYYCDEFIDTYKIQDLLYHDDTITTYEVAYSKLHESAQKVNMKRFIYENSDEGLDIISNYYIRSFDWSDTKFNKF